MAISREKILWQNDMQQISLLHPVAQAFEHKKKTDINYHECKNVHVKFILTA